MSSPSHPFRIVAAVMVAGVLLPLVPLFVVNAFSATGPLRPVFGVAGAAALAGVIGAASTVREVIRAGRTERERVEDARAGASPTLVLARWSVGSDAPTLALAEWTRRKREVIGTAGVFAIVGAGFLWVTQDGPPWAAFAGAGFFAGLYLVIGLGKHHLDYKAASLPHASEVVVFPDAVRVLGAWHALAGDRRLSSAVLTDDALLLSVEWDTRGGPVTDVVRVPVPADAREQAELAAAYFQEQVGRAATPA